MAYGAIGGRFDNTGSMALAALISNGWSFAGDDDRDDVNAMLLQPLIYDNLPEGWYLVSSPIITANGEADCVKA